MKRMFPIIFFLLILIMIPYQSHDYNQGIQIVPVSSFVTSADGDESSESIISFSKTLADQLFYPDQWLNNTVELATSSYQVAGGGSLVNDSTETHTKDESSWAGIGGTGQKGALNFTYDITVDGFDYNWFCMLSTSATITLQAYDWTAGSWVTIESEAMGAGWGNAEWLNGSFHSPDYWNGTEVSISITSNLGIWYVDYAEVQCRQMLLSDSDHYSESFASVDDVTISVGETVTTDDDLGTFHHPGDNSWDFYYFNSPSDLTVNVIELRAECNQTGGNYGIALYSADNGGGSLLYNTGNINTHTAATTKKYAPYVTGVECIRFVLIHGSTPTSVSIDYLRAGPADEMGWQHDGSTTEGTSESHADSGSDTTTSDGDKLHLTGSYNLYSGIDFSLDTTTTESMIKTSDYPFMAIRWKAEIGQDIRLRLRNEDATSYYESFVETGEYTTTRLNIEAELTSGSYLKEILIYDDHSTQDLYVDWIKVYSIANFTVTQGSTDTDEFLYVDSGILTIGTTGETDYSYYFLLNYDPALSVATATHNVWNLTLSSDNDYTSLKFNIGGWGSFTTWGETRGSLSSGTLSDLQIQIAESTDGATISAVKFIEDSTAPTISDFWTVPYTPTEEDDLTLAVYETDGTGAGTYTVEFNAVDYPVGFSDVDYSATESSTKDGLWSYTFDSTNIPAGYYAFEVTASDGANSATDLEILRVVTVVLQITDIVLITATAELAQISGHSNKDCSYSIYENDTLQGSGSVSDGWFSIAWTKDDTAGAYIELGVKFYVSSYTDWVNGSYSVASAEVLHVTDTVYSASDSYNYLSGHLNLDAVTWTAFDNDTQKDTGALNAGSFSIHWAKVFARGLHEWGVSFTDGVTTRWVNGSYEADGLIITDLIVMQNNESIIVGGFFYTSNTTLTWESYEAGVFVDSGTLELASSGEYNSIYWEKNTPLLFKNFTLSITADGSTINLHSYSLVLDTATYLTTISGGALVIYEGDNYFDDSTTNEGVQAADMATLILEMVALIFISVILGGVIMWRDSRIKDKDRELANIASGGYQ